MDPNHMEFDDDELDKTVELPSLQEEEFKMETEKLIELQRLVQLQVEKIEALKARLTPSTVPNTPEVDVFDDESDESIEEQDFPPTSITISTNVHEVGGSGVKNKVELSLCASMVSRKAMQNALTLSLDLKQQTTAYDVLRHLQSHFLKIPSLDGKLFETHKWDTDKEKDFFLYLLEGLAAEATEALKKDKMLIRVQSPCYILGDIHGSYRDLEFFARALWHLGMNFTPSKFLFLGDFVERGPHSVEVIAYLLALKIQHPNQVFLIRGNHEFREQNGKKIKNAYIKNGFMDACCSMFAKEDRATKGKALFELINSVFDYLPMSCILDEKIFCCHGGVPRTIAKRTNILEMIEAIPRPLKRGWMVKGEELREREEELLHLTADLLWADPCEDDVKCDNFGFADNKARGTGMKMFNSQALIQFLKVTQCTHIVRAHQEQDKGIKISKNTRCLTLFSSSRYQKNLNQAACLFFDGARVRVTVIDVASEGTTV